MSVKIENKGADPGVPCVMLTHGLRTDSKTDLKGESFNVTLKMPMSVVMTIDKSKDFSSKAPSIYAERG